MEKFNFDSREIKKQTEEAVKDIEQIDFHIEQIMVGLSSLNLSDEERKNLESELEGLKAEKRFLLNKGSKTLTKEDFKTDQKTSLGELDAEKLNERESAIDNELYKLQGKEIWSDKDQNQHSKLEKDYEQVQKEYKRRMKNN